MAKLVEIGEAFRPFRLLRLILRFVSRESHCARVRIDDVVHYFVECIERGLALRRFSLIRKALGVISRESLVRSLFVGDGEQIECRRSLPQVAVDPDYFNEAPNRFFRTRLQIDKANGVIKRRNCVLATLEWLPDVRRLATINQLQSLLCITY